MIAKYIRVSTTDQNTGRQETTSTDVKQYVDKISGAVKFAERPQASKLIKDIEQGKIDEVIIHNIDRIGRNQLDILTTIEYLKAKKNTINSRIVRITDVYPNNESKCRI